MPRTSTGPAAVEARQKRAVSSSAPMSSSSGRLPPPVTSTRASPSCA
ncbi:hypothetical protein ACFQ0B_69550 [Nonomuraea thailandensis]